MFYWRALILCVPLLACPAVFVHASDDAVPAPIAVLANGETFAGRLTDADAKQIRFETGEGPRSVGLNDLVTWGALEEPRGGAQVLIGHNGILIGVVPRMVVDSLRMHSDLFGNVRLPRSAVAGLLFAAPYAANERDHLSDQSLRVGEWSDLVRFVNGDIAQGAVRTFDDKQVLLRTAAGEVAIERVRVSAIWLSGEPPSQSNGLWVGFKDGSRVFAQALRAGNDEVTAVVNGVELTTSLSELVFLQRIGGKAEYVSNLKLASEVNVPLLGAAWMAKFDASVTGGMLRAGGRPYLKGVGMHSASRVTFAIPSSYRRLRGRIAIDDSAGEQGSVVFRVFVDSQQRFRSDVVRGGEAPTAIDVDVSGGKQLSLFVEMADQGDILDRANWLNLRLSEE